MEITKEWIAQQRAVCDAATPGPWEHCGNDAYSTVNQRLGMVLMSAFENPITDTNFAAAARTALPAALDEVERLLPFEAECAALRAQVDSLTRERDAAASCAVSIAHGNSPCDTCENLPMCAHPASCPQKQYRDYEPNIDAPEGAGSEGEHA